MAEKMDRGTDALTSHVDGVDIMQIRQTRRGWFQEILGCEARTEMKYFVGDAQIAQSLEDSDCFMRLCCAGCHPFATTVKELNTDAEMITVDRPFRCGPGPCKCCCYQEMTVKSGSADIGYMKEDCYYCIPTFTAFDPNNEAIYKLHPPTCCGGCCMDCCTEGNPCGKACCVVPIHVFPADQAVTDGKAPYVGKIVKKPKSIAVEIFTDANTFDVHFPKDATPTKKGLLMGASLFINAMFFEGNEQ